MASENIVKLNVGGTVFMTSKSTLLKFDSYFRTMLESGLPHEKDDAGCIFIDRSPKQFDIILNYLRDGSVTIPTTEVERDQILREAQYYLLDGLIAQCGGEPLEEKKKPIARPGTTLQATEDVGVYNRFLEEFKAQHSIVIRYDKRTILGNVFEYPLVKELVDKHRDKWNILLYGTNKRLKVFEVTSEPGVWKTYTCTNLPDDFDDFTMYLNNVDLRMKSEK